MSVTEVLAARFPEDLFGTDPAEAVKRYRELSRQLHPDSPTGNEDAFKVLTQLYEIAQRAILAGTYGDRKTIAPIRIRTRRNVYEVTQIAYRGDVSVIYDATYTDEDGEQSAALLKVARDPRHGAQLAHEAKVLKEMLTAPQEAHRDLLAPYIPSFIEAFGYRQDRVTRQALAFDKEDGLYTLVDVARAYPHGVHPKDSAWMLRRVLMALGLVHNAGWTHGQTSWEHILISEAHDLLLVDWRAAKKHTKELAQLDLVMGVSSIESLSNMDAAPTAMKAFYRGCRTSRLPDAFTLKDEFDELLEALWGPRVFHPFVIPKPIKE